VQEVSIEVELEIEVEAADEVEKVQRPASQSP
jgi:hypothetical protein